MKKYQEELKNSILEKDIKIRKLENLVKYQRKDVYKKLKKEKVIKIKNEEINRLRHKISENKKEISKLSKTIDKLKNVKRLEISGRMLPVKIISTFTKDSILKTKELFGIKKDDVVLIKDASGGGAITARILSDMNLKAVIVCNEMSHAAEQEFFKLNLPVLYVKDLDIEIDTSEELAAINPENLENAIKEWNEKVEKQRIANKEIWLESLVHEYRTERIKEIKDDKND